MRDAARGRRAERDAGSEQRFLEARARADAKAPAVQLRTRSARGGEFLAPDRIDNHGVLDPNDRLTRISTRAISSDPQIVTEVATTYCDTLRLNYVHCTLKHFPGLGRVVGDTHIRTADLNETPDVLAKTDWVPFRKLMQDRRVFTMLSHARLTAIDKDNPASISQAVVGGLLRDGVIRESMVAPATGNGRGRPQSLLELDLRRLGVACVRYDQEHITTRWWILAARSIGGVAGTGRFPTMPAGFCSPFRNA